MRLPRGKRLTVSREIAVPSSDLWDLLVDVSAWLDWGPTVSGVESDSPTIHQGSRGRVRTSLGPWLPFTVTEFEAGHRWSWSVGGLQATDHSVRDVKGGCVVTFGVPWWAPAYLAVCALALRRLEKLATSNDRPPY